MRSRLLVFELHHLGDAVLALPFLRAASARFEVFLVCRPSVADLIRSLIGGIHFLEWESVWSGIQPQQIQKMRSIAPCVAVSAWPDTRVHTLMALSTASQRIGFTMSRRNYYGVERPWRRRRLRIGQALGTLAQAGLREPLLTSPLERESTTQAHWRNWLQIAQALGLKVDLATPWCDLSLHSLAASPIHHWIENNRSRGLPIWVLHSGGRLASKRWPEERFTNLLREYFATKHLPVMIVRPPGESCPEPQSGNQIMVQPSSWAEVLAIFQEADLALCNDSLASHLASALGKGVVTVFGSADPAWFAPFGNESFVASTSQCPYRPCVDRCVQPSFICLNSVSEALVVRRLDELTNHWKTKNNSLH